MAARISRLITLLLVLFISLQAHASLFSNPASSRFVPVDQAQQAMAVLHALQQTVT